MRKPVRLALVSAAVLLLAEEELKNPIVMTANDAPFNWRSISPAAVGRSFIRVVMINPVSWSIADVWGEDVYID